MSTDIRDGAGLIEAEAGARELLSVKMAGASILQGTFSASALIHIDILAREEI